MLEVLTRLRPPPWSTCCARFGPCVGPGAPFPAGSRSVLCRTPAYGGHVHQCEQCEHTAYSYHSCGNRHYPKCQGARTERWPTA